MSFFKKDIIIYQPWGGLGDNLQYSTLPELYSKLGHRVYISDKNVVRNQGIHDLVWGMNPYIRGVSTKRPNCGSVCTLKKSSGDSIVTRWELSHGFKPLNQFPKVYYSAKLKEEYKAYVFLDLHCTTQKYDIDELRIKLNDVLKQYEGRKIYQIRFKHGVSASSFLFNEFETKVINDIYEYCDLISSCHALITLSSGSAVLASAIKASSSFPHIIELWHPNNGPFVFKNVQYVQAARFERLNIGCQEDIRNGWINLNDKDLPGVNQIYDIQKLPLPFKNNEFTRIIYNDRMKYSNYVNLFRDLIRILAQGGSLQFKSDPSFCKGTLSDILSLISRAINDPQLSDIKSGKIQKVKILFCGLNDPNAGFKKSYFIRIIEKLINLDPKIQIFFDQSLISRIFPRYYFEIELNK